MHEYPGLDRTEHLRAAESPAGDVTLYQPLTVVDLLHCRSLRHVRNGRSGRGHGYTCPAVKCSLFTVFRQTETQVFFPLSQGLADPTKSGQVLD